MVRTDSSPPCPNGLPSDGGICSPATVRLYMEKYEAPAGAEDDEAADEQGEGDSKLLRDTAAALADITEAALKVSSLQVQSTLNPTARPCSAPSPS